MTRPQITGKSPRQVQGDSKSTTQPNRPPSSTQLPIKKN